MTPRRAAGRPRRPFRRRLAHQLPAAGQGVAQPQGRYRFEQPDAVTDKQFRTQVLAHQQRGLVGGGAGLAGNADLVKRQMTGGGQVIAFEVVGGKAGAFLDESRVTTLSIHEARRWPFSGTHSHPHAGAFNFSVPPGLNDSEFNLILRDGLLPLAERRLGGYARHFLPPLWRRLTRALAGQRFDPAHPERHASYPALRAEDWQQVVELVEAEPFEAGTSTPQSGAFSLTFRTPTTFEVQQATVRLHHDAIGCTDVFIVTVGVDDEGRLLQAVFN